MLEAGQTILYKGFPAEVKSILMDESGNEPLRVEVEFFDAEIAKEKFTDLDWTVDSGQWIDYVDTTYIDLRG